MLKGNAGTEGRTRTDTVLPPPDFESGASTSFATSAAEAEYNDLDEAPQNNGDRHGSMRVADFHYELPQSLIARYPSQRRTDSRLLHLDGGTGAAVDRSFTDLRSLLRPGDFLVLNDTRVMPARMYGRKDSGGRVELMLERVLGPDRALVQVRASKSPKPGQQIHIAGHGGAAATAVVERRQGDFYVVRFRGTVGLPELLDRVGQVPLPPYLNRAAAAADRERYQTVYARHHGAVAAPTAGLHFDHEFLESLRRAGVETGYVTLHVGAGTFQPVRVTAVGEHRMHAEWMRVSPEVCERIAQTRRRGGRVVAVGTTSVRALETAAMSGTLMPFEGDTRLFLYPGSRFRVVDALLTNFHLPESTLLMLVCAFAGLDHTLAAYRHAVAQGYRFYSYGDAMFVTPRPSARVRP